MKESKHNLSVFLTRRDIDMTIRLLGTKNVDKNLNLNLKKLIFDKYAFNYPESLLKLKHKLLTLFKITGNIPVKIQLINNLLKLNL